VADVYAPPSAALFDADDPDYKARYALLKTEHTIKTFSDLNLLGGGLSFLSNAPRLLLLVGAVATGQSAALPYPPVQLLALLGFAVMMAVGQLWAGWKLRKLDPVARRPAMLLCLPWLLFFPIGTLLSVVFLHALNSGEGRQVLTPEHRALIERTPGAAVKTPTTVWVALLLIVLGAVGGAVVLL